MQTSKAYQPRSGLAHWALLAMPVAGFLLHAAVFRNWLIDDAGISFTYSRNLAQGYGLVSQPGVQPVEAYSNFLWVILLVPFFVLRIFEPVLTLKTLSVVLVIASFAVLYKAFTPCFQRRLALPIVLTLTGLNTAFAVWTTSGLENPLYVLLVSLMLVLALRSHAQDERRLWLPVTLGLLAAALAMTRPDGIVFVVAYPLLVVVGWIAPAWRGRWWSDLKGVFASAAAFALLFGAFLVFRLTYFGDLWANTYYAKGGPSTYEALLLLTLQPEMVVKALTLVASVAGRGLAGPALLAVLVGTCYVLFTGRFRSHHLIVGVLLLCSAGLYLLLPDDGMGEYRFGTPFVMLFYIYGGLLVDAALDGWRASPRIKGVAAAGFVILLLAGSVFLFVRRSARFVEFPPIPYAGIVADYGLRYDNYAADLGIPVDEASVLLPDMGGTLYTSHLRIYDLGMLADKTIALTLGRDQPAFYDYVFDTVKPTFIHVHDVWSRLAALDDDSRFRRDYMPLYEYPDAWAQQRHGITVYTGDYVRKDVLNDRNRTALAATQARWARRIDFNKVLYLLVSGEEAEAERAYQDAAALASPADFQQAIRDVNAFLTIYPLHPQARTLQTQLRADLDRR